MTNPVRRLSDWIRWHRAWSSVSNESCPWPAIEGAWPLISIEFRPPPRWGRSEVDWWAERFAAVCGAHWFECMAAGGGRWRLVIDGTDWRATPPPPLLARLDGNLAIPLGIDSDGPAAWDLRRAPHLLVGGATGSGKSSLLRALLASIPFGWAWRVVVVDPKRIEFERFRYEFEVSGLDELPALLEWIVREVEERKQQLVKEEVDHWLDLCPRVVPVRPVLLVLDEAVDVFAGTGLTRQDAAAVRDALGVVLRQGRATGVHVVAAFTRPDTDVVAGALRDQFAARIGLGALSPDAHRMLFGSTVASSGSQGGPGIGAALGLDGSSQLRRFRCPLASVEAVRRRYSFVA